VRGDIHPDSAADRDADSDSEPVRVRDPVADPDRLAELAVADPDPDRHPESVGDLESARHPEFAPHAE
jgi:hypothetical protein